ncbi:HEAT repeat domain-containing protein [Streptomyces sp. NPDC059999]|uniref:HEAT repeat domain-containing protein n=1 Tax=Streptomyces sp. NPDC059999 TaxID=3347030 RepID=UPI0036B9CBB5
MTTSADHLIDDALHRSDVEWLSDHLDARSCPLAVLRRLVRHADPRLRHLGLLLLSGRVTSTPPVADERETAELASLLPHFVVDPPEAALLQANLHAHLGPHLRGRPRPSWRTAGLPVRVRIAWLRAELLDDPTVLRHEVRGELLYQAVRETSSTAAHRPERLVAELVGSGDRVLRAEALRLAREGLHAGLLTPARVREHVLALLDTGVWDTGVRGVGVHGSGTTDPGASDPGSVDPTSPHPTSPDPPSSGGSCTAVVVAALRELGQPWAMLDPLPEGRLSVFLTSDPEATPVEVAEAALTAAARHGHRDVVWRVAGDPGGSPALRRRALELLGDLADRGDIRELTALAARDPLLLGAPAVACLRGLHRRGHFPADEDVPAIVGLALADHAITPDEVATILFTCRQATLRVLIDADDNPGRSRRLALLVALAGQGARELPVGEEITRVFATAGAPEPFLAAIRELRYTPAEDVVIALLPTAPAAALDVLEAIGGHRTVRALREGLGLPADEDAAQDGGGTGVIAPHLRAVRDRALELLWQLTDDQDRRRGLLVRLDPIDLPARIAADLGGPDEEELALLGSHLDPDEPLTALCRLAAHGGAGTLPTLADLLLRVVGELAAFREPGGDVTRFEGETPNAEPIVPREAEHALTALGSRLYERRRIRPSCLLDAANAPEAGRALLADLVGGLLDRPGLSDGEQSILLELLSRAPGPRVRARVHRPLRHRDRHVRKHALALLARDVTGDDAQALSATLIALTRAGDVQTVRRALLALRHARARWACTAIAACLAHPNMNVKKTAAQVLVRAGAPPAVADLLRVLGRHDNPGLRVALVEALRAILGDAYAATVLAAAEHCATDRARALLAQALDGALPARSILALSDQASPVAPALLALVACGRVRLSSGTREELAPALGRHGIASPAGPSSAPSSDDATDDATDFDVASLAAGRWNPAVALRVAERPEPPHTDRLRELRPLLSDWLRLADSAPRAARAAVLRFTLRLCPAPWTDGELASYARSARLLVDALTGGAGEDRPGLVAVLEAVAPLLTPASAAAVVDSVRALPPAAAHTPDRPTLTLLRRCGAVLVRADLDRALAVAGLGADPWRARTEVLREAFAVPSLPAGGWRTALEAAARTPAALADFRRRDLRDRRAVGGPRDLPDLDHLRDLRGVRDEDAPGSRERLSALIDVYSGAAPEVRDPLLDWMTSLQPLDAPPWTIGESAAAPRPAPGRGGVPRRVHADDLDQPRSAALRDRLLTMLDSPAPDRRNAAARALLGWPEPGIRLAVLRAALRGRTTVDVGADLARIMTTLDPAELRADEVPPENVLRVASRLAPPDLVPLLPLLSHWWEHGPPAVHHAAEVELRRVPVDVLAHGLGARLAAGAPGFVGLIAGRAVLRTPALTRACRRLRAEGHDDLADRILLVDGPLRGPEAVRRDAAALASLRERARASAPASSRRPTRQELSDLARTGTPDGIRRVLTRLVEEHRGPDPDPVVRELIGALLHHAKPGVRLHAHRTSRAVLDRQSHLLHTQVLLHDPQPDVVRMAVRSLSRAAWEPAIPALVGLLDHARPEVRRTAADGLARLGTPAVPALRRAADHARPDRRTRYTDVLGRIAADTGTGTDIA